MTKNTLTNLFLKKSVKINKKHLIFLADSVIILGCLVFDIGIYTKNVSMDKQTLQRVVR